MKITPLDLAQQKFRRSIRGYDPAQVEALLELVRAEWGSLLGENQRLSEDLGKQEDLLLEYREKERTLQETLMTAQRLTDDLKQSAKKEADIILGQAELQADKIIHQAHGRLTQIIDEINEIKRQRAEFEGKLRGLLESHLRLLELQREARETVGLEDVSIFPKAL